MRVVLAGYNVDSTVLDELKRHGPPRLDVTPETISASYARISRDPRPVDELRAVARLEVDKARRSNRTIIFKMGHHSVAEHAVFNFDVIGVSRLAIEEIERFRLNSYTEKSQRYIKLGDDHILPEEVGSAGLAESFLSLIREQNALYHRLYGRLRPLVADKYAEWAGLRQGHAVLDGWAMEDARYVLSLATVGQLGMTINARNLEHMIRRFAAHPLAEIREFNRRVFELAKQAAPSIILFTDASDFDTRTYAELGAEAVSLTAPGPGGEGPAVRLIEHTPDPDDRLLASLLHTASPRPFAACRSAVRALSTGQKRRLVETAMMRMEFYDAALREFEFVDLTFELVLSASAFAQLKRHRMATLTVQPYDPGLGVTVPPSVEEVGARGEFTSLMEKTDALFHDLARVMEQGAAYVLTNAHRRRVLWKVNAREFYHFSRLREDATAQWDIRRAAAEMAKQAAAVMPLTMLLIGGKDAYPGIYRSVFGREPKLSPPDSGTPRPRPAPPGIPGPDSS